MAEGTCIGLLIGLNLSSPRFKFLTRSFAILQYAFSLSIPIAFLLFFIAPIIDEPTPAKEYTSKFVFGRYVHVAITDTDRYSRLVGKVFFDCKTCLNEELLKAGMAWHYKKYDTSAYWSRLELSAKRQKKGLWAGKSPVEPWQYRRKIR